MAKARDHKIKNNVENEVMAYEIIIKQSTREQVKTREYKHIGTDEDGKDKFGYVDDESTQDVRREIYTQRVDELDMAAVIKAVNGMNE